MSKHAFHWIDAFTTKAYGGNPCAVIFDADRLSADQMQRTTREIGLSETAFVMKSTQADFKARYFTPVEEIPLAGHPTIATAFALNQTERIKEETHAITLELPAGIVDVEIERCPNELPRFTMRQLKPQFLKTHDAAQIADLFSLTTADLLDSPVQTVSTGTPQLMVPLRSHEALKKAKMKIKEYTAYKRTSDFFSPHLFCTSGITPQGSTFARHLGVPPDTEEDAFTGSATGGMAAYLWRYELINKPTFFAEQGHWMGRPGIATVEITGAADDIEYVKIRGNAVSIIQGEIEI